MNDDLLAAFAVQANLLGADVLVTQEAELPQTIVRCAGDDALAVGRELAEAVPGVGSLDTAGGAAAPGAATLGHLLLAATGTVLLAEREYEDRVLRITARHHVAVVPAASIVGDMADAGPVVSRLMAAGRKYLTFVSGPSRTADIEKVLTIGVHGPERLTICAVTDWKPLDD